MASDHSPGQPRSAGDLWREAAASLSEELQSLVEENTEDDHRGVLERLLYEAHQKRKDCVDKQWRIKKRNGDIIILRDAYEKITTWVEGFRALGNAARDFMPAPASIPWGVVSFLIQVSIAENEAFAAMLDGLEKVTSVISRFALVEKVYFLRPTSGSGPLRAAMISLYASILSFLGTAHKSFSHRTATRYFRSLLLSSASTIEEAMIKVEAKQMETDRCAQVVGMEILQHTALGIQSIVHSTSGMSAQLVAISSQLGLRSYRGAGDRPERLEGAMNSVVAPIRRAFVPSRRPDHLDPEERREIYNWLSSTRFRIHHIRERKTRLPRSGEWMFETPEFQSWKGSSISGTLWLHGKPGSGKTKLASAVIDRELDDIPEDDSYESKYAPLAYFYCSRNRSEPERAEPDEIVRCIARQLCRDKPELFVSEALCGEWSRMGKPKPGEKKLSLDLSVRLIQRLLQLNPATIVIDALDECNPATRHVLFEALDEIVSKSPNVVKLFVTSRDDADVVCRLSKSPNIYVDALQNSADITRFTSAEVSRAVAEGRLLGGRASARLQQHITAMLDTRACGTFRWVSLQIQNLSDSKRIRSEDDVLHELRNLPESLQSLHDMAFQQVQELSLDTRDFIFKVFQILLVAVRPMVWEEIVSLISVRRPQNVMTKSQILDLSANFIEDSEEENRPRLAHSSTREYLESRPELIPSTANLTMALLCLDAIQFRPPAAPDTTGGSTYPFFYLAHHLSNTSILVRKQAFPRLRQLFIERQPSDETPKLFRAWRHGVKYYHDQGCLWLNQPDTAELAEKALISADVFFAVCAMGLSEMIAHFSPNQPDVSHGLELLWPSVCWSGHQAMNRYRGRSCLEVATILAHHSIIQAIAARGLSLNQPSQVNGEMLLHLAARRGDVATAEVLLACGADPNCLSGQQSSDGNITHGHQGQSSRVSLNPSPRHWEHITGHRVPPRPSSMLGFRQYHGGQFRVSSPFNLEQERISPLHIAVEREDGLALVDVLLRFLARPNMLTSKGSTPLQLSLGSGKATKSIMASLLCAGAEVNAILDNRQTVLHLAAAMDRREVVELLVRKGGDPRIKDAFGRTAIDLAIVLRHIDTAKIMSTPAEVERLMNRPRVPEPNKTHTPAKVSRPYCTSPSILMGASEEPECGVEVEQAVSHSQRIPLSFSVTIQLPEQPQENESFSEGVLREWQLLKTNSEVD